MIANLPKSKAARAKAIEKAMKLTWASLESHLPYTYTKDRDGFKHHRDSISEYVSILVELNKLY